MATSVTVTFDAVDVCHGALTLGAGGVAVSGRADAPAVGLPGLPDLRDECARLRMETPVLPGAVTAAHDVSAMPLAAFSNGDVIGVSGGGTGSASGFPAGGSVLGAGTSPLVSAPQLSVLPSDASLRVPALVLAAGTIRPALDPFGRETLVIEHAGGGPYVDLLNPLLSAPAVLAGGACGPDGVATATLTAIHPDAFAAAIYPAGAGGALSAADVLVGYGATLHARTDMTPSNNPPGEPWPVPLTYAPSVALPRAPLVGSEELVFAASTSGGLVALLRG